MNELLSIRNLHVKFVGKRTVHALNDVNLELRKGESLGIIGESGSGKSVTLRAILKLLPANRTQVSGSISFAGQDIGPLQGDAPEGYRGKKVGMIFQDSALALDPLYSVGAQIMETIRRHNKQSADEARMRAIELLRQVGIPSPETRVDAYPHQMSGGMRQRAMIAIALSAEPELLLADEPTTALDATVQIQVLLLLRQLQKARAMSTIFVTHDIGAAIEVSDRIAVMYGGKVVESGLTKQIVSAPRHPYTRSLLSANLHNAQRGVRLSTIAGSPPTLDQIPTSCSFAPRCPQSEERCRNHLPESRELGPDHLVACFRA